MVCDTEGFSDKGKELCCVKMVVAWSTDDTRTLRSTDKVYVIAALHILGLGMFRAVSFQDSSYLIFEEHKH